MTVWLDRGHLTTTTAARSVCCAFTHTHQKHLHKHETRQNPKKANIARGRTNRVLVFGVSPFRIQHKNTICKSPFFTVAFNSTMLRLALTLFIVFENYAGAFTSLARRHSSFGALNTATLATSDVVLTVSTVDDALPTYTSVGAFAPSLPIDPQDHTPTLPNVARKDNDEEDTLTFLEKRLKIMLRAASLDHTRLTHASLGLASLGSGVHHVLHVCTQGWTSDVCLTETSIVGAIHIACCAAGLFRLEFRNAAERARNACFWPILPGNIWMLWSSLTEWGCGSHAPLSVYNPALQAFTVVNIVLAFYQLAEVYMAGSDPKQQKIGIWMEGGFVNSFSMFWSYQSITLMLYFAQLWISLTTDSASLTSFIDRYPEFANVVTHAQIDTAFASNLGAFLVTLFKYKACDKRFIYALIITFNIGLSLVWIMPTLYNIAGGEAWHDFLNLAHLPAAANILE